MEQNRASNQFAAGLIAQLQRGDAEEAWSAFVHTFASTILRAVSSCEREHEDRAEAFVFVFEHLHRDQSRRLRKFQPQGPASFTTWLHAVVRNLCRDWRRKRYGRLPAGESVGEAGMLAAAQPSPRDGVQSSDSDRMEQEPRDPGPSPEEQAQGRENLLALGRALPSLTKEQRLALRLRVEEDLTFQEISTIMALKNAQAADRLVREAVQVLRSAMKASPQFRGKTKAESV